MTHKTKSNFITRCFSFSAVFQDVRFGFRMLAKSPGFTLVAVMTLAVGIGSIAAIFSVVNAVLLQALPYEQPSGIVQLWGDPSADGKGRNSVAAAEFMDWKEQNQCLENISAVRRVRLNLTGEGTPEQLNVLRVSASFLQILRIQPLLGRDFLPDEDAPGKDKAVVLTHRFWQRRFGGDADSIGRSIRLGDDLCTVIGVLPAQPELPYECDVLAPFVYGSESWHQSRRDNRIRVLARLKEGVTLEGARADMSAVKQRIKSFYPEYKKQWGISVVSLHEEITGPIRPQLWILFSAVGFVLAIACANVAGLLIAKSSVRQKEMALRTALGASRWRVIRQLLTESVILSLIGGCLGMLLAYWGVDVLKHWQAANLPRVDEIAVDLRVLGFAFLASIFTGVLFGLAPAWRLTKSNWNAALKEGTRSTQSGPGWMGEGLIVFEIALALVLLAGAGLLMKTLYQLHSVPTGFNPENVLTVGISFNDKTYPAGERRTAFLSRILNRLESIPGVLSAGSATTLPMNGATDNTVRAENQPDRDEFYIGSDYDFVLGDYFQTMGVRLLKGRVLNASDNAKDARRAVVVNEALANKVFPNQDPVGRRVYFLGKLWEIVGLVGDVRHRGLDNNRVERIYAPQAYSFLQCNLVVRTQASPMSQVETVRKEILQLDPNQPISNVRSLERIVSDSLADRRLVFVLLAIFSSAALLLAAIGLYGVMSQSVSHRTKEIGIRMALGAEYKSVMLLVMKKGIALIAAGVCVGLLGAFVLTRVLTHLLFGVEPTDPVTLAGVSLALGAAAAFACWLPARRATQVDPMTALRCE